MATMNSSPAPEGGKGSAKLLGRLLEIAIFGGLLAILYFNLFRGRSPAEMGFAILNVGAVVVGIGFLIFIHELGHFLAAKWCDVKVETFSIGFGRAIPGCSVQYGETLYKLAMFPIGGYVKMLGQTDPGEEETDAQAAKDSPRSYMNKTVGQRLFIISAGVVMNLLFGFLAFIYVYMVGKNEPAPFLGTIEPGSPADLQGLRLGDELLGVDGIHNPSYEDLFYASLLSTGGKTLVPLELKNRQGGEFSALVTPRKLEGDSRPTMGVGFPEGMVLNRGERAGVVPAIRLMAGARTPFQAGDRIIGARAAGSDQPFQPIDHGWQYVLAEFTHRKRNMELEVRRGEEVIRLTVAPQPMRTVGLVMEMGPISVVSPKKVPAAAKSLQVGDVIVELDGNADLDPVRLPDLLADNADAGKESKLKVRRGTETFELTIPAEQMKGIGVWTEARPSRGNSPMPVPMLGVAYEVLPRIKRVEPGSAAEKAGFRPGMKLVEFATKNEETGISRKLEFGPKLAWPQIFYFFQLAEQGDDQVEQLLTAQDDSGKKVTGRLVRGEDPTWFFPSRGLKTEVELRVRVAGSVWEAMQLGFRDTWRFVARIYLTLYGFLSGSISPTNLAGPVQMAQATYAFAERGFNDLIHFLGMISINLAVVNFLPIPVLDGGHAVMLILEKLRGKPINEKVFAYATYAGLAIILGLMLFVTLLDLSKFTWWQRLFGG